MAPTGVGLASDRVVAAQQGPGASLNCLPLHLPPCAVESFEHTDTEYLKHNDNASRDDG